MLPVVSSIAGQFEGKAKVGKVNIAEEFELANEYAVMMVPKILIFNKNKKPEHQIAGLTSENEISKLLNKLLEN